MLQLAAERHVELRQGLPLRAYALQGGGRRRFERQLRRRLALVQREAGQAARAAADVLGAQFVARRLPGKAARPSAGAYVRWADPLQVRVVMEARPGQEPEVQIYHSLENEAAGHMRPDVDSRRHLRGASWPWLRSRSRRASCWRVLTGCRHYRP